MITVQQQQDIIKNLKTIKIEKDLLYPNDVEQINFLISLEPEYRFSYYTELDTFLREYIIKRAA